MANIISRPFRFTEYELYAVPSADESKWLPINPSVAPPRIAPRGVFNKFIYVFQRFGEKFELYAELFSTGLLSIVSGRDARSQERDKRATPQPLGSDGITLPHTINGKRAFYTFLVSRIRLPADSITGFESKPPKGMVQDIDLASDSAYIAVAQPDTSASSEVQWFVGVTDPASIAENLHQEYAITCDLIADFAVNFEEQTAEARNRSNDRHRALLLARLLRVSPIAA